MGQSDLIAVTPANLAAAWPQRQATPLHRAAKAIGHAGGGWCCDLHLDYAGGALRLVESPDDARCFVVSVGPYDTFGLDAMIDDACLPVAKALPLEALLARIAGPATH
jgi:hypothetical protein